jgi:hypothetical protein
MGITWNALCEGMNLQLLNYVCLFVTWNSWD